MSPQSYIMIGRSGSGKGTQAELLVKKLKEKDQDHDALYVYTGDKFRDFITGDSYTQSEAKKIYEKGLLEPEFLVVSVWSRILIDSYKQGDHLIFDGTPRKFHEAGVLDSVFGFYGLERPYVIHLDVGDAESMKRLLKRKRLDDTQESIRRRLEWYKKEVTEALKFYEGNPKYRLIKVDGERSVEDIHADIVKKVGLE